VANLTDRQEKFVQELIKGKSQREAYKTAYNCSRMKDTTIDVKACELFKMGKVSVRYNEIHDRLIKEAEDECIVEAKDLLKELVKIAFANGSDFAKVVTNEKRRRLWDEDLGEYVYEPIQYVEVIDTDQLSDQKKAAIKSIKQGRHGIEIELYPKDRAIEMLGKHLKIFTEQLEVKDVSDNPYKGLTTEELKKLANL
jgi:phage terminase small subunit